MSVTIPPGEFVGKIILFQPRGGGLSLAARAANDFQWWVDEQKERSAAEILASISVLYRLPDFDSSFGFHKEIPHSGRVIGGGIILRLEGAIYLNAISQAYGRLPRLETEKLMGEYISQQQASTELFCGEDLRS